MAEVLITLTIIGVIAALTIPNLIAKHDKDVTVTKLKKVYSTLSEACAKIELDDPDFFDSLPDGYDSRWVYILDQKLRQHLKVAVGCDGTLGDNIYSKECAKLRAMTVFPLNKSFNTGVGTTPFILEDGTIISYANQGGTCGFATSIWVNINGFKGPNIWGKDIFEFIYNVRPPYPRRLIPQIPGGSYTYCAGPVNMSREVMKNAFDGNGCSKNGRGRTCAALIMKDGWQILDDYPW